MDLIFMNSALEDIGVLMDYELDLAFGADENDFECQIQTESHCCEAGFYLYIEGTEYGGIIDNIKVDTAINRITYSGRTWHGMLDSKVLEPDSGQSHLTVSGEANEIIAFLLTRMGLSDLFVASSVDSGIIVNSYQMNRYITGYSGIVKMLDTVGAKLQFNFKNKKVVVSAVMKRDYTQDDEFDSDNVDFILKKRYNTINHLVCLGSGEMAERTVIHLYLDADGNVSQTQTFFGLKESTAVYDYPSAGSTEELIKGGTEELKSLMANADFTIDCDSDSDSFDVGDVVGAYDNATKIAVSSPIKKKIVSISNGKVTITLKPGQGKSNNSGSYESSGSGTTGKDGADGYTPEKGKDYWTESDIEMMVDEAVDGVMEQMPTLLEVVYPIGSIYISGVATNPATLFGFGTWEQIEDRFLLAAGSTYSAGSTGGEATHTLTVDELPAHYHNANGTPTSTPSSQTGIALRSTEHDNNYTGTTELRTASVGGDQPHNNMPPYLAVYIWKRTA